MNTINIDIIKLFDQHLLTKGLSYRASIIGGTAIMLIANQRRTTGDVDSLLTIPDEIKNEIRLFAKTEHIADSWFNDNASRNYADFVMKGQDLFAKIVFKGEALQLYTPSIQTLILSKIYPILDRPDEGKDLQDLDDLIAAGVASKIDFESALEIFVENLRFESDRSVRKASRLLADTLRELINTGFPTK